MNRIKTLTLQKQQPYLSTVWRVLIALAATKSGRASRKHVRDALRPRETFRAIRELIAAGDVRAMPNGYIALTPNGLTRAAVVQAVLDRMRNGEVDSIDIADETGLALETVGAVLQREPVRVSKVGAGWSIRRVSGGRPRNAG